MYGTAAWGGAQGSGTFFRLTRDGRIAVLHEFAGGSHDGAQPAGAFAEAADGNFYGTTNRGGALGFGTLYRMTRDGRITILRSFYAFDGDYSPLAVTGVIEGSDGHLYGTVQSGGKAEPQASFIYRYTLSGTFTVLRYFDFYPSGIRELSDGNFYGSSRRSIFRVSPEGILTYVYPADYSTSGESFGTFIEGADGHLYGYNHANTSVMFRLRGALCVYAFAPSGLSIDSGGGTFDLSVSAPSHCVWSARSTLPWITVLDPALRAGDATIRVTVAPKSGSVSRTGALAVGKTNLSVTQTGGTGRPLGVLRWDIDGDARTDIAVWRPGTGTWYSRHSSLIGGEWSWRNWGGGWVEDRPVPGDYDGDGRADFAVWRPGTGVWYILTSSSAYGSHLELQWGGGWVGDIPVPADYDGDGRTDVAVWRPATGTWYVRTSSSDFTTSFAIQWGLGSAGDEPAVGDYDGDGRADLAVWRGTTGFWYVLRSHMNYSRQYPFVQQWGLRSAGDQPIAGDYDGDGATDFTVWRGTEGWWYLLLSGGGFSHENSRAMQWGGAWAGDTPIAGDYDGDGVTDIVVWRGAADHWYIKFSLTDFQSWTMVQWGSATAGDVPLPR